MMSDVIEDADDVNLVEVSFVDPFFEWLEEELLIVFFLIVLGS